LALISAGLQRVAALFSNRTFLTTGVVSVLSTAIVIAAVQSDGTKATNVRLDDGSVWVTNQERGLVGRLNLRIDELDFAVSSAQAADVLQETIGLGRAQPERIVLFSGRDGGVQRLEVVTGQSSGKNEIPIVDYRIGGGVGAVLDRATGRLWVGPSQQLVAADYPDKPDALVAPGSWLVVTRAELRGDGEQADGARGRVLIVDDRGWYEVELGDDFEPVREEVDAGPDESSTTTTTEAPAAPGEVEPADPDPIKETPVTPLGVRADEIVEVSAVGSEPVVLTADGTVVLSDGTVVAVPGGGHRLQQASTSASVALVASDAGLFAVSLRSGDVEQLAPAAAAPAAPVRVGPCIYGAWSGEVPTYVRACNDQESAPVTIPGAQPDSDLVFRVNQRNVALNSVGNGDVWADHDGTLAYVGNWSDVEPQSEDSDDIQETVGESQVVVEKTCIEGGSEAPTTGDDQLGVRPRQTIIDVLSNDDDVNCEPIAIASVNPASGEWGQLTVIGHGQHLLYSPSDQMLQDASASIQTFQFTYTAKDIDGHESSPATVTLSVKDFSLGNSPPALRPKVNGATREMRTVVEEGRAVSYNVLADWWDPDGDDLRLVSAVAEGSGQVSFTPDGVVRYAAYGVSAGIQKVSVTMSDGRSTSTESLEVTVKPTGSAIPPITSTDFVTLVVGGSAVVAPLENDSDPNEDRLDMRPLWTSEEQPGYSAVVRENTVEITGLVAGVYALDYMATDNRDETKGTIRLEVVAPGEVNQGPIAVPDQVKLRPNRVVNVDVLANDIDADGDLLAVTDVRVAEGDPSLGVARATLVDRRMVQVEVVPGPDGEEPTGPFTVTYVVSDGKEAERAAAQSTDESTADALRAQGAVTVLVQPASEDQPPVLTNDTAVVRSGDIVAVPVLRNDTDPDSDPITLVSVNAADAARLEQNNEGVAWVQGRDVYFQGGWPGRYTITYNVEAGGKQASAELAVVVKGEPDPAQNPNQPPEPPDLELRAIRNGTVRVRIPSYGSDPDGDSVVLEALGVPGDPTNRVVLDEENPGVILVTAGRNAAPTDSFTYTVIDRFGERGTGTVKMMVLDDGGWAPLAHDDVFRGKPGRTLSIPVLANDTSPHDRSLEIAELPFFDQDGQPTDVPKNPTWCACSTSRTPTPGAGSRSRCRPTASPWWSTTGSPTGSTPVTRSSG
jgi:large repetitive protein